MRFIILRYTDHRMRIVLSRTKNLSRSSVISAGTPAIRHIHVKIQVFWDVELCGHWSSSWCCKGLYSLHVQGHGLQEDCLTVEMKALCSFEMSGTTQPIVGRAAQSV